MQQLLLIDHEQEIDFMQNKILKEGKDKTEKKSTKRKQEWDGKKIPSKVNEKWYTQST